MDIRDVVKRSGLPASTLRFYEEKGLVMTLNEKGERRRFAANILDQLALIALGQSAGFTLEEIRLMLAANGGASIDRQALMHKAEEIEQNIKRLRAVSLGLKHAAQCPAPSHAECPTFQRLLKAQSAGAPGKRKK
jgi:DNA-binding transcriptional MerR regulator